MTKNYQIIEFATELVNLKKEFQKIYDGKSHIPEIIPKNELFPITQQNLSLLHEFANKNPIYYNSYEKTINGIECIVYEGDINRYWLGSISHPSNAPFSPTWIVSAYVIALLAKELGYHEIIDVGSGDGRIAFCAKMLEMNTCSIEIDGTLVELQESLTDIIDFNPYHSNAISFDYSSLSLKYPVFVIGGLAQMGGDNLAVPILEKINEKFDKSGWVFTGTYSQKYPHDPKNEAGWGTIIQKNNLRVLHTVSLPTCWTFHEPKETPYVFATSE